MTGRPLPVILRPASVALRLEPACSLQALRHTGFGALAARVSEIDSEAFSLPIAKARGLQTGGTPILTG